MQQPFAFFPGCSTGTGKSFLASALGQQAVY